MPRKIQRDAVQVDYAQTGSLRAEDLPYNASESIKTSVDARTPPEVTTLDDGKLTQAYYETPPVYGDEADGDVTISSGGSGNELSYINDVTDMTADAPLGATSLNVRDGSAFSQGDEIMLHQTQCYRDPTKRFQYEFRRIASVVGNVINLTIGLSKAFDSDSGALNGDDTKTQVIRVPNYNILTLNSGAGICARPWNGYAGGVLVFRAKTLAGAGVISGTDAGFRNVEFYYTPNEARSCRNEGPLGTAVAYLRTTWEPTGVNENYVSAFHDVGAGGSWNAGGSGQAGTANVVDGTSGTVTIYGPTPYTKDGVNPITGADLEDILPMPTGYFQASISTFQAPFRAYYGTPTPRNINSSGGNASGAAILCFVQSHAGFTGAVRSRQVDGDGEPNAGGYVAFYAESAFTGTTDVTTNINGRSGVFGDNGLFYSTTPTATINKGQQHGPKVVSTDAASGTGDILDREAGDERWGNVAETDPIVGAVNGLVKADGGGNISAAVEDTDYQGVPAEGAFADGDKTKLDGIEAGADVTDATNVDAAGATMNADPDVSGNSWVVDEDDMVSDLATKVPTQQSVKAYVDVQNTTDTWQRKVLGIATDPPGSPTTGDRYIVAATATGAWVGQEDKIAEWDGSAWVYTSPFEGMRVPNVATTTIWQYYAAAWNEATPVNRTDGSLFGVTWFLDEDAMTSDDPTKVPSQQSVKAYVDNTVASAKSYQGGYDASTDTPSLDDGSPIAGISAGDVYDVTVAGNFFTIPVEVGDTLTAKQDSPTLEAHWVVTQTNLTAASIKSQYESNTDTNAFTDAEQTKLAGIEAGADVTDAANVNAVESDPIVGAINGLVKANGAGVISAALEDSDYQGVPAEGAFADGDKTKLDGIETAADVTDQTNVTSALGAVDAAALNVSAGAGDAGKLVKLDADGHIDASMINDADVNLDNVTEGATNKSFTATEQTKLSGIETNADVTDTANVDAAGATMNTDSDVSANSWVVDEDTLVSDLATKVPTQQSVKAYVDLANVNQQTGNYTLALSDRGKLIQMANASNAVLTIPTNASVAFPTNSKVYAIWAANGVVTITGDTGVSVNGVSAGSVSLVGKFDMATLIKIGTDEWYVVVSGLKSDLTVPTYTPTGTTETIDWKEGPLAELDLGSATGDVTLTFTNMVAARTYRLRIVQGATARNVILPSAIKMPGGSAPNTLTITATDNAVDYFEFYWDGVSTGYGKTLLQNYG